MCSRGRAAGALGGVAALVTVTIGAVSGAPTEFDPRDTSATSGTGAIVRSHRWAGSGDLC